MKRLALLPFFLAMATTGCSAAQGSAYGYPSLDSALWLSGWGLVCLLAVALYSFRSRLIEVREQGEGYREMVEEVNSIIMRSAEDGTILFMNRFALEYFGWEEEEILGRNVDGTLIPETGTDGRPMGYVWDGVRHGKGRESASENENQRKDGTRVWVAWTNKWVAGPGGSREVLSVGTDRTALREQRLLLEQVKLAAENAPDAVVITDAERKPIFINSRWEELLQGRNMVDVLSGRVNLFECPCGVVPENCDDLYSELSLHGIAIAEVTCGELVKSIVATQMRDPEGDNRGYLSVVRDITQEKATERDLREARRQAEAASRTKSLILSNVTHEIRTPLNGVLGMLQILLMGDLSDEQKAHVETAMDAAMDLGGIVSSILKYSEVDSDDFLLETQPFSLLNTMLGVMEDYREAAAERDVQLSLEAAAGTLDGLNGDGRRIRQVADILLGNAIKFTPQGAVTMRLATTSIGKEGVVRLTLAVEDTGVGIAEDRLPLILTGFVQGDQSYSRRFGGLGLGLGMARKLADLMGGDLTVQSREGVGTTVTLSVFLDALLEAEGARPMVLAPMTRRGERPRVLLALEDDLDVTSLKFFLQCRGVEVLCVSGTEAGVFLLEERDRPEVDLSVFHVQASEEESLLDRLQKAEKCGPVVLLGGATDNACSHDLVVYCSSYPIRHDEFWSTLLQALDIG